MNFAAKLCCVVLLTGVHHHVTGQTVDLVEQQRLEMVQELRNLREKYTLDDNEGNGINRLQEYFEKKLSETALPTDVVNSDAEYDVVAEAARKKGEEFDIREADRVANNKGVAIAELTFNGLAMATLAVPVAGPFLSAAMALLAGYTGMLKMGSMTDVRALFIQALDANLAAQRYSRLVQELDGSMALLQRSHASIIALANDEDISCQEFNLLLTTMDVELPYVVVGSLSAYLQDEIKAADNTEQVKRMANDLMMFAEYTSFIKMVNLLGSALLDSIDLEVDGIQKALVLRSRNVEQHIVNVLEALAEFADQNRNQFGQYKEIPYGQEIIDAAKARGLNFPYFFK